jgi:transposase-like protein
MMRAIEECLPRTARQRCLAHKVRNLQSKVPEDLWPEFNAAPFGCYQAASPGRQPRILIRPVLVG